MADQLTWDPDAWFGHLRRDRRGIWVPWINLWGREEDLPVTVRPDRHAGGRRAVFMDDRGQDVPDFTRQCLQRQREAMAAGLCQVCARPVPWSRRRLVLARLSVEVIPFGGRTLPVVTEPWLDERCAGYAVEHCPALIRRSRADELTVVPVTSQRGVQLVASVGWVSGPLEAETRAAPPVMWLKLHVPGLIELVARGGLLG